MSKHATVVARHGRCRNNNPNTAGGLLFLDRVLRPLLRLDRLRLLALLLWRRDDRLHVWRRLARPHGRDLGLPRLDHGDLRSLLWLLLRWSFGWLFLGDFGPYFLGPQLARLCRLLLLGRIVAPLDFVHAGRLDLRHTLIGNKPHRSAVTDLELDRYRLGANAQQW